jgi:hypothetical protein
MKSQKEIIEALKTIKDVCVESKDCCEKCPLFRNLSDDCGVCYRRPARWDVKDKIEWRAFN